MSRTLLSISTDGVVSGIYDDDLADLYAEGRASIRRASYVEPTADGQWTADLSPVAGGPILGPFALRSEALQAEREWLEVNLF